MQCEICGIEIFGKPRKIMVEGSEMNVCPKCTYHGTVLEPKKYVPMKTGPGPRSRPSPSSRSKSWKTEDQYALIGDYGHIIREEREKREWTQEELAAKINEKASLLGKIEREDITPDDETRRKIERMLEISLVEPLTDQKPEVHQAPKGVTLGDIAMIKKR